MKTVQCSLKKSIISEHTVYSKCNRKHHQNNTTFSTIAMPLSVVVGGDVVINGPLHRPIAKNPVYRELHTADTNFVNLEMPFASPSAANNKDTYGAEKLIALHTDPSHAPVLQELGLDVVTVANNHRHGLWCWWAADDSQCTGRRGDCPCRRR